jgi:hypothetical protein
VENRNIPFIFIARESLGGNQCRSFGRLNGVQGSPEKFILLPM